MEWLALALAGGLLFSLYWTYRRRRHTSATVSRSHGMRSSEVPTPGLMERANALTQAYARVLEQRGLEIPRPESHLPGSKEAIKAALLLCALSTVGTASRRHDTATLRDYQMSYGFLAHFITEKDWVQRSRERMESLTPSNAAPPEVGPGVSRETIAEGPRLAEPNSPSPLAFLSLCEEFAQRFDALTDRERGRTESLRIQAALLGQ